MRKEPAPRKAVYLYIVPNKFKEIAGGILPIIDTYAPYKSGQ